MYFVSHCGNYWTRQMSHRQTDLHYNSLHLMKLLNVLDKNKKQFQRKRLKLKKNDTISHTLKLMLQWKLCPILAICPNFRLLTCGTKVKPSSPLTHDLSLPVQVKKLLSLRVLHHGYLWMTWTFSKQKKQHQTQDLMAFVFLVQSRLMK